jgi:signal transduction histidine kinase/CheY-like chemotaxis protein
MRLEEPLLSDDLPCALFLADTRGLLVGVNRRFAQLMQRQSDALVGCTMAALLHEDAHDAWHEAVMRPSGPARPGDTLAAFELAFLAADEGRIRARVDARWVQRGDALVLAAAATPLALDAPAQASVLNAEHAAQQVPGVLFVLHMSREGWLSLPYASEALKGLYGVGPEQVRDSARALFDRVHPDDLMRLRELLHRSASDLSELRDEHRLRESRDPHQGTTWVELHATPRPAPDFGTLWHGYAADVTARRAAEAALTERDAAERASRAKSEFLARVSHELRTPLNSILGFARLLDLELRERIDPKQRAKLRQIEHAGQNLLRLIDEVLDISRIEAGRMELELRPVALGPLLNESARLIEPQAALRQVQIKIEAPHDLAVRADRNRLQQALLNLLSNAVKYNREGGRATVRLLSTETQALIEVHDQGHGLDESKLAQLFQPFNRLGAERSQIEGVGLGLLITRGLVEMMGGQLRVRSDPPLGSCFSIALDLDDDGDTALADALAATATRPAPLDLIPEAARPRIALYIEDNPVNIMLMESMFELRRHWQLRTATCGAEGLAMAGRERPDLLLLDMQLPDGDGIHWLHRLRELPGLGGVRAVAVSADAMPEDIALARARGFDDYWTKPLDVDLILNALDDLARAG